MVYNTRCQQMQHTQFYDELWGTVLNPHKLAQASMTVLIAPSSNERVAASLLTQFNHAYYTTQVE